MRLEVQSMARESIQLAGPQSRFGNPIQLWKTKDLF